MRTTCATMAALLLTGSQLFADGPITRSTGIEASRLAAQPVEEPPALPGWQSVIRLDPGEDIQLTTKPREDHVRFVWADAASIVVIHPARLPAKAAHQLIEAATHNPEAMAQAASGGARAINDFVIGPDGVFFRGTKLAERINAIQRVTAEDVVGVSLPLARRGSASAAATGVAAGFFGSVMLAKYVVGIPETWSGLTILAVGIPAAAGAAAWYGSSEMTGRVIYQAPARP